MRLGKLNNEQLERLILSKFQSVRPEVRSAPRVGEDCAVIDPQGQLIVLSSDPITSAAKNIGTLSVHINCNDAAAAGAEPVGIMVTLLAPPSATEEELECIAMDISAAAQGIGVDVLGGHTEVTDAVTRYVTSVTVVARMGSALAGMCEGNDIVLTKWAGMEGSALIAHDFAKRLHTLDAAQLARLQDLYKQLSVVPDGAYAARHGATAMHDVTEGGVLGAAWEMCYAAGVGMRIDPARIPVLAETRLLCEELGLDVFRLLSSGCMLIACEDGEQLAEGLEAQKIPAAVIGKAGGEGLRLQDGTLVLPPEADELYKLF